MIICGSHFEIIRHLRQSDLKSVTSGQCDRHNTKDLWKNNLQPSTAVCMSSLYAAPVQSPPVIKRVPCNLQSVHCQAEISVRRVWALSASHPAIFDVLGVHLFDPTQCDMDKSQFLKSDSVCNALQKPWSAWGKRKELSTHQLWFAWLGMACTKTLIFEDVSVTNGGFVHFWTV